MGWLQRRFVVESDGPESWRLYKQLAYRGASGHVFIIPAGQRTDFASVPRIFTWLIPRYGVYTLAAILHDHLCRTGIVSRRDADGLFRRCLREHGVSTPRRWMMWAAVRTDSHMSDANRQEWAQYLLIVTLAVPLLLPPLVVVQLWVWAFDLVEWIGRARH